VAGLCQGRERTQATATPASSRGGGRRRGP
jgi:hypothetical protein